MSSHINTDFQMPKSVTLQTRMKCSRIKIYNTTVKLYSQVSNISDIYKAKIFQYFFCSRLLVSIIQTGGGGGEGGFPFEIETSKFGFN